MVQVRANRMRSETDARSRCPDYGPGLARETTRGAALGGADGPPGYPRFNPPRQTPPRPG